MKLLIALGLITWACATTKIADQRITQNNSCTIFGTFQKAEVQRYRHRARNRTGDIVNWKVVVKSVSDRTICPALGELAIRVRGADFSGDIAKPIITYPVDLSEPKKEATVSLKMRFLQGRDSYLERDYAEWTLDEVVGE